MRPADRGWARVVVCLIGGEAQESLGRGTERLDKPALVEDHPSRREQSQGWIADAASRT